MFDDYIFRETAIIRLTGMFLDNSKDYREACKAIEKIHAADVRENVRGHWITCTEDNTRLSCSVCGADFYGTVGFIFCPNCGADMRGEWKD